MNQTTYREEGRIKCPACQREVAQVREITKASDVVQHRLLVSRHLYQEDTEVNGIGLPNLNADGFCPGSFNSAKHD